MYLNELEKRSDVKEIVLSPDGTIHTNSMDVVDGFRLIFSNLNYFPYSVEKQGYWHINKKYRGQMYSLYLSRLTNDWWINLFPRGWGNAKIPYYTINPDNRCTKHYGLDKYTTNLRDIEGLIFEVVEQLHGFDSRHNTNIYKEDIKLLRKRIDKEQNEILEMNLNRM